MDFPEVFRPGSSRRSAVARPDRYSDWGPIVRALANGSHDQAQAILDWPVREVLQGYVHHLRREALAAYRFSCVMYALQAPHLAKGDRMDPPVVPAILRKVIVRDSDVDA